MTGTTDPRSQPESGFTVPQFRDLMESIPDAVIVVDPLGHIVLANWHAEQMFGYREQELLGQPVEILVPERYRAAHKGHRDKFSAQPRARPMGASMDLRGQRKDGTEFPVDISLSPVVSEGQTLVISAIRDISEYRHLEQLLREKNLYLENARRASQELFTQLTEAIREVFFLVDPEGTRVLYVSPAYEDIFGYSISDLYKDARAWMRPVLEEDRPIVEAGFKAMRTTGRFGYEYRIRRPDGAIRWVHTRGFPVQDDTGKLSRVAGVVEDITERKEMQEELRESEHRFRDMLANIELLSVMLDPHARVLYCNDFLLCLTGWTRNEIIGRDWFDVVKEPGDTTSRKVYESLIREGSPSAHHETYLVTRTGERRLVRWNSSVLRSPKNEVIGTASIGEDITEQKRAAESIRRLNRVYAVLSGINTLIVRTRDRQQLFHQSCRIAVEQGGFGLAWIGTLDPDDLSITPLAMHGPAADVELISKVKFSARQEEGRTPSTVSEAIRTRRPAFNNDFRIRTVDDPLFDEFAGRGYCSAVSLPLVAGDTALGVAVFYSKEAGFFDEDELNLLTELAGDISFALEFIKAEEQINFLAYHDPLTSLSNREALRRRLSAAVTEAGIDGRAFALILMNLNDFRDINDTLGHRNGDILLQQIATRLKETVWESDVVASLGGDEFAILIPRLAEKEDIDVVVEKITRSLHRPFEIAGVPIVIEARMGIALFPSHGEDADRLWQHADVALRSAYEQPGMYCYYHPDIDHYDPQNLTLLGDLRGAIDRNELVLHWQPKVDVQSGRTSGVEALIRWQHPQRGLIFPDKFLPFVEHTGLIDGLTIWVIANAMRQGHHWHRNGFPLDLAINISARNLLDPELDTKILEVARSSRFPLSQLTVEVTESAIMDDPARAHAVLDRMNGAGIQISMDDFGIGQSSLTYLKDLPISRMKIDRSFVIGFKEPRNAAIVRSAVELGHHLQLRVTAEGVEDEETFLALREMGCDRAQGYYISKPLPADELIEWLKSSPWPCVDSGEG